MSNVVAAWLGRNPFIVGSTIVIFTSIVAALLVSQVLVIPKLPDNLALIWFAVVVVAEFSLLYFLIGLDSIVEKNQKGGQHYIGIGLFYVSFAFYIVLIVLYAPLYQGRIQDAISIGNHDVTSILTCVYFSAITIATVGYGDVTPLHGLGRVFASVEAISGFFVLILLANTFGKISVHRN